MIDHICAVKKGLMTSQKIEILVSIFFLAAIDLNSQYQLAIHIVLQIFENK